MTWSDAFRYGVLLVGCVLVATNFSFIAGASVIFPRQTCWFWRVFFVGKSLITGASILILWNTEGQVIWWRSGGLLAGYTVSLSALMIAYVKRPFTPIPLTEVVPAEGEITLTEARKL